MYTCTQKTKKTKLDQPSSNKPLSHFLLENPPSRALSQELIYVPLFSIAVPLHLYSCTNRVQKVSNRQRLPSGTQKIAKCSTANFSTTSTSNLIMPSKPKSSRREYLSETISAILELHKSDQIYSEIAHQFKIPKSSVTTILHLQAGQPKQPLQPTKRLDCPSKLDARVQRAIICQVKKCTHENLHALSTPSKSGSSISRITIHKYLKAAGYFRFKAKRKPFLSDKHKAARLKWVQEHKGWTLEDWLHVIYMDKVKFETGLETRSCYITRQRARQWSPGT